MDSGLEFQTVLKFKQFIPFIKMILARIEVITDKISELLDMIDSIESRIIQTKFDTICDKIDRSTRLRNLNERTHLIEIKINILIFSTDAKN